MYLDNVNNDVFDSSVGMDVNLSNKASSNKMTLNISLSDISLTYSNNDRNFHVGIKPSKFGNFYIGYSGDIVSRTESISAYVHLEVNPILLALGYVFSQMGLPVTPSLPVYGYAR